MLRALSFVALLLWAFTAFAVRAAEPAPESLVAPGANFSFGSIFEKMHASYSGLLEGPRMDHLDGNLDGKGTFLQIKNYVNADYEVAPNWRVELNTEFRQYFRPEDPKRPGRPNFEMRDPSLGLARRNIVDRGNFTLSGRTRFFLPVSDNTRGRVGKAFDTGNGSVYFQAVPSWRWLDGKLSLTCPVETYINLPKRRIANSEEYSIKAKTQVAYQVAHKWAARVEYSTGDVRHTHDGHWSKLRDREMGHKVVAGAAYAPVKEMVLNPALTWGRDRWRLKEPEVSLFASYNFL